jgi:hypothetical protein
VVECENATYLPHICCPICPGILHIMYADQSCPTCHVIILMLCCKKSSEAHL